MAELFYPEIPPPPTGGDMPLMRSYWRIDGTFHPLSVIIGRVIGRTLPAEVSDPSQCFSDNPEIQSLTVHNRHAATYIEYDSRGLFSLSYINRMPSPAKGGLDENLIKRMNTIKIRLRDETNNESTGRLATKVYSRDAGTFRIIVETMDGMSYRRLTIPAGAKIGYGPVTVSPVPQQYHALQWKTIRERFYDYRYIGIVSGESSGQDALVYDIRRALLEDFEKNMPGSVEEFISIVSDLPRLIRIVAPMLVPSGAVRNNISESHVTYTVYIYKTLTKMSIELSAHPIAFMNLDRFRTLTGMNAGNGTVISGQSLQSEYEKILNDILPVLYKSGEMLQKCGSIKNQVIEGLI